jgi:transcriptional regulator with XRE-family HTH domain
MAASPHREQRKSWGQRVSARREELRLSQAQLQTICGLPQQTISRVELDLVVPRYGTMAALAKGLGTTIEALFPVEAYPHRLRTPRKSTRAAS